MRFNQPMTADDKASLARFLDIADDFLRDGFRLDRPVRAFRDDADAAAPAVSALPGEPAPAAPEGLDSIAERVRACRACRLGAGRTNAVPGEGAATPLVLVVGEGPGADEDATGRPFVGKAGQLLDKMLAAVALSRGENCFIANVVKCRPPNNRDPEADEIAACAGFLDAQIDALRPTAILSIGRVPTQALLGTADGIGKLRGRFFEYRGHPLLPTYHPSALLRDESLKRPAWEDLKKLRAFLDER